MHFLYNESILVIDFAYGCASNLAVNSCYVSYSIVVEAGISRGAGEGMTFYF